MAEAPTPGSPEVLRARLENEVATHDTCDAATVIASIKAGECDTDWDELLEAMRERIVATDNGLRWRLDLDDLHVTQDELTLEEARIVQRQVGRSWLKVNPIVDAEATVALITAVMYTRGGLSMEQAVRRAREVPAVKAHRALSQYVEPSPFDSTSTTSSDGAPVSSDGPPPSPSAASSETSLEPSAP